jgi:(p)ppGpp synthase/HD superfamily hydrolase
MTTMTINRAIHFIKQAHAGQRDKHGEPYWLHPASVMQRLGEHATNDERKAALLHDVLEDSTFTVEELRAAGFSETTIDIVKLLTRDDEESYVEYILRIAASGNRSAVRIKLADLDDNLDRTRGSIPDTLRARYLKAQRLLLQHLYQIQLTEKQQ